MKLLRILALLALGTACGDLRYTYTPVTTTSAEMEGESAARVVLQGNADSGELRIASFGVADQALNLRIVIINSTDVIWRFDPAAQRVEIYDGLLRILQPSAPPPKIELAPHTAKTIDLALPIGAREEGDIGRFVVLWSVEAGDTALCGRVPFVRHLERRTSTAP
jgi:hypothetical protein